MKKLLAILLACTILFTACGAPVADTKQSTAPVEQTESAQPQVTPTEEVHFDNLSDPALLQYMEDTVYTELVNILDSEDYFVENVNAIYLSNEYLEEVAYNSQANIYFGYTLEELDAYFQGEQYVFTLGADGHTAVKPFESYDDTYEQIIKNVAIGTGVILVCVTVSVVTTASAPAVSVIFAASAKSGTIVALSSGALSGAAAGAVTGIETGDFEEAMKAAALAGSEGFMWGAISGCAEGAATTAINLKGATLGGLSMDDAAKIQRESKYPVDVIKRFQTMEQYEICKKAGLTSHMIDSKTALIRDIDLTYVDSDGLTNLARMQAGSPPLDPTGTPYELHHIGQKNDSTLAILTQAEHRKGGNHKIWHYVDDMTENPCADPKWGTIRKDFWKSMADLAVAA